TIIMQSQRRRSSVLDYEQSLMFGQYREKLANFASIQSQKSNKLREERQKESTNKAHLNSRCAGSLIRKVISIAELGGDWILLAILSIILAFLSFVMDIVIHFCFHVRDWLQESISDEFVYKYLLWIAFSVCLILSSAIFVRYVSPQAAGSGVGEMKVILRGVVLKGSGLPLGKEGPFVHMAAMVTNQLIKLFPIRSQNEYESRFLDLIAVACAVGVATTFAAPVGGVLYSIEIVSVFFSVRSYWMGFFAATIGALFWRLFTVWSHMEDNITHLFKTNFRREYPYETLELISFAILGIFAGISAFLFVTLQRHIVLFNRKRTTFHIILQRYPLIYPVLVTTIICLVSFPPAFGQYYGSWLSSEQSMHELFSNYTWGTIADQIDKDEIIDNWKTPNTSVYVTTFLFFVMNLVIVALGSTLPVPSGLIIPSFKIGAGLGRFYGEWMAYIFPKGINPYYDRTDLPIIAGAYAVAGSAAFAGANTGALSSAVIIFEVTGQMTHLLPVIIAVITATLVAQRLGPSIYDIAVFATNNSIKFFSAVIIAVITATLVAQRLGPSIYDSLIKLKKLPYLPPIIQSSSSAHRLFVQEFMERDLMYVWEGCSYRYLRHLLNSKKHLNIYPFVKSPETMILLGTVERIELQNLLESHLSKDQMIDDLKKSPPVMTKPSPTCPIHGQQPRFHVATIPENEVLEITSVGKHVWEENQLEKLVDFTACPIDPAPFQLVEGTSLMKAHNMFSLLGLQLAFVTVLGRLIGVVALKEIRKAIEQMNSRELPRKKSDSSPESKPLNA
ncbi:unnamed protein product, partial [Medioppia subpectinata]